MANKFDLFANIKNYNASKVPKLKTDNVPLDLNDTIGNSSMDLSILDSSPISNASNEEYKPKKGQKSAVDKYNKLKSKINSLTNQPSRSSSSSTSSSSSSSSRPSSTSTSLSISKNIKQNTKSVRQPRNLHTSKKNEIHPLRTRLRSSRETVNRRLSSRLSSGSIIHIDIDDVNDDNDKDSNIVKNLQLPEQHDDSYEEENCEVMIKVKWMSSGFERIKLRKYQKFADLIDYLAIRDKTTTDKILLNMDDRIINENDTPNSIGYNIGKFINGRVVNDLPESSVSTNIPNKSSINIKIQSDKWKKPLIINMEKTDKFKILLIKCAEEFKCNQKNIRIQFDGDFINPNETPIDLDLDGGEVMDVILTK